MSLLPNRLPYWFGRFGARFISFSDGVTFRTHQIAERGLQCCKLELVAEVEGFPGHDAPTMNDGLRDHAKPHPEQHAGGWQASRFPYHLPEGLRKLLAAHDAGGRAIQRPMDPGVFQGEDRQSDLIGHVDPGQPLGAWKYRPAKPAPELGYLLRQSALGLGIEDVAGAHDDRTDAESLRLQRCLFPGEAVLSPEVSPWRAVLSELGIGEAGIAVGADGRGADEDLRFHLCLRHCAYQSTNPTHAVLCLGA